MSLLSGAEICRSLRRQGHRAVFVDMFFGISDPPQPLEALFDAPDGLCPQVRIEPQAPDLEQVRRLRGDSSPSRIGPNVLEVCRLADAVFLALHGEDGEDGRIQGALELLGVPYTGAGRLASALAMDKIAAKRMMDAAGIATPPWQAVCCPTPESAEALAQTLPMPCVVKVPAGGSSLGVYLPQDRTQLKSALCQAAAGAGTLLVERRITGRELTAAVLGDRALPAAETFAAAGRFDYAAKYQSGAAKEVCPAELTDRQARAVEEMALSAHRCLGLCVYSRTDMILDEQGRLWCLEVNSLPGMTPASFLPKEAAAAGLDYDALCREILELSLHVKRR